jgi:hypothetical protein
MDRLAVHVIATAALTVTLATVPVLFADACHASSSTVAPTAAATPGAAPHASSDAVSPEAALAETAALAPAVAVLPALSGQAQTQAAASAPAGPAPAAPDAPGPAADPADRTGNAVAGRADLDAVQPENAGADQTDRGRMLLPRVPDLPCGDVRQIGATTYAHYRGIIAFSVRQYYSPTCHAYLGYSYAWYRFRRLHVPYDVGMAVYDTGSDAIEGAKTYVGGADGPGYWSTPVRTRAGVCTKGEGHFFYYPSDTPGGFIEGDTMTAQTCAS